MAETMKANAEKGVSLFLMSKKERGKEQWKMT
jgi:hypothetical protein